MRMETPRLQKFVACGYPGRNARPGGKADPGETGARLFLIEINREPKKAAEGGKRPTGG